MTKLTSASDTVLGDIFSQQRKPKRLKSYKTFMDNCFKSSEETRTFLKILHETDLQDLKLKGPGPFTSSSVPLKGNIQSKLLPFCQMIITSHLQWITSSLHVNYLNVQCKQRNHGRCMKKIDKEKQFDKFGFCRCTCVFVYNPINHVEENSLVHSASKNIAMNCTMKSFPFTKID